MISIPDWLSAVERTQALGNEMYEFISRRNLAQELDPNAKVEPHPKLLELIADAQARLAPSRK